MDATLGPIGPKPVRSPNQLVRSYAALLQANRAAGLMRRRRTFYLGLFSILLLAMFGAGAGLVLLGDTWFQLLIAAVLGILCTQFAFLAHEASHHQVFTSRAANEWSARIMGPLLVGMSYHAWVKKHNAHHQDPNVIDRDPDIHTGVVAFHEQGAATKHGLPALFTRHQGTLVFPLMLFLGLALIAASVKTLLGPGRVPYRALEISLLALRFTLFLTLVFWLLPIGLAVAFLAVQLGVWGFYMGASFAPNHKGMPILPADSHVDFLTRQVVTSRNIRGGFWMDVLMGGLNHQVEHHLFPDMARPYLRRANEMVREACTAQGITLTETTLAESYKIVIEYLNRVGLSAADPFECPMVRRFRRLD